MLTGADLEAAGPGMAWLRRHRVGLLRVAFIPIVLLAVFARPRWPLQSWAAFAIEALGYLVVVAGLLFRLWSIMYIGERKSRELVVEGPYSLCRHPLYTGTFLLSIGAGLCFENPPMSLAAILLVIPIHAVTAGMEERKLAAKFGSAYTSYAEGLPRFIPHFGRLRNMEWVKVSTRSIRRIILETVGVLLLPVFEDLLELLHDCDVIPVLWHFF